MGCRLPKLKRSDESSPGKIYSTLKRLQVETKVGVAYTYRFVDFILGKEDGSAMLCLSSVTELPAQLSDLYQQGFVLAAVHPFVHPCGPESARLQRRLYRALLVCLSDSVEKTEPKHEPHCLEMEVCLSADQSPSVELIQAYVKRIQDTAEQGVVFAGFIQEPAGEPSLMATDDHEEISLSLHSSPSSVLGGGTDQNQSPKPEQSGSEVRDRKLENGSEPRDVFELEELSLNERATQTGNTGSADSGGSTARESPESPLHSAPSPAGEPRREVTSDDAKTLNNNKSPEVTKMKQTAPAPPKKGAGLFALFNHSRGSPGLLKYYTVKVPLGLQLCDEGVGVVEANWLDHMTQHFSNGASLVDGYFHLGDANDVPSKLVDSIFIFQEGVEGESITSTASDAIVVEQWSVIDGVTVKTDYIPLLQSLAVYGWRLTCVLPTPVVKTNSDGSLATKQIVFLQRPVLPRKKKESKKLSFKTRSKSSKNSVKDAPKKKRKKGASPVATGDTEEQKAAEGSESACGTESERVAWRNRENRENDGRRAQDQRAAGGEGGEGGAALAKEERQTRVEAEEGEGGRTGVEEEEERNDGTGLQAGEPKEDGIAEKPEQDLAREEEQRGVSINTPEGGGQGQGQGAASCLDTEEEQEQEVGRDSEVEAQVMEEPRETLPEPSSTDAPTTVV